jgi:hypothetical protein
MRKEGGKSFDGEGGEREFWAVFRGFWPFCSLDCSVEGKGDYELLFGDSHNSVARIARLPMNIFDLEESK